MNPVHSMQQAYGLLYENHLRTLIVTQLESHYGTYWELYLEIKRPIHDANLTELIAYFGKYPSVLTQFCSYKRKHLYALEPIRAKILRTLDLSVKEYNTLKEQHTIVISQGYKEVKEDHFIPGASSKLVSKD